MSSDTLADLQQVMVTLQETHKKHDLMFLLDVIHKAQHLLSNLEQQLRTEAASITKRMPSMLLLSFFNVLGYKEFKNAHGVCKRWYDAFTASHAQQRWHKR